MPRALLALLCALPLRAAQIEGPGKTPLAPLEGADAAPELPQLPSPLTDAAGSNLNAAALPLEAAAPTSLPPAQAAAANLSDSLRAAGEQATPAAQSQAARESLDLAFDGGMAWLNGGDAACGHCGVHAQEADFPTDDEGDPFIVPGHLEPLLPSHRDDVGWTTETSLHAHSYYSDGTMSPEDVVELAWKAGVKKLALSDHDTVAGVSRAYKRARELGVELRPSVELTTREGAHVNGVDVDVTNPVLLEMLERTRRMRYEQSKYVVAYVNGPQVARDLAAIGSPKALRALEKLEEFRGKGKWLSIDDVVSASKHAEGGTIERPHIARALLAHGLIENVDDAFETFFKNRIKVPEEIDREPTVQETLDAVHAAGGKAFLNHPYTARGRTDAEREKAAYAMLKKGFDGIEVYRPPLDSASGRKKQERSMAKYLVWADELGLLVGAGADFHGADVRLDEIVVWMPKPLEHALDKGLAESHARAVGALDPRHGRFLVGRLAPPAGDGWTPSLGWLLALAAAVDAFALYWSLPAFLMLLAIELAMGAIVLIGDKLR
jgi:3',5'-nucleoside bisphosphate phosphatase